MSFITVAAVAGGIGGLIKTIDGASKAKKLKKQAKKAKQELERQKAMFRNLDTSNPYLNLENVYEDMTVNQKEAEFMKQQQMQQQANIMQQMRGTAGGSGIAALAQTMANKGSEQAQQAAVSIGKQEAANQEKKLGEEARIQDLEREGELISRQAEFDKVSTLMGMSADELAAKRDARAGAQDQMWGGIGDITGSLFGAINPAPTAKKGKIKV
jgi:cysteinyl-tRNA synthetase